MSKKKHLEGVNSNLVRGPIKKWAWLFILPTFAAFCIGFVWPFIQGIYLSFCKFNTPRDAKWVGISNYLKVFSDQGFMNAFKNTALFAIVSIILINVIAFFIAWNDFVYGISLTSTDAARPVPAALAFFTGASQFEEPTGAISAAAIIVTIPVVVLVLAFQRQIVSGLTQGAVKG